MKRILYFLAILAKTSFFTFIYVVFQSWKQSGIKVKDYQELDKGFVRCDECGEYFDPVNECGLCPHENFKKWLKEEPKDFDQNDFDQWRN